MPWPGSGGPLPPQRVRSALSVTPPAGRMLLVCANPKITLPLLLGSDLPQVTSGYGGWNSQPRPQKRSYLKWDGPDAYGMTVQVILDGFRNNVSVQSELDDLLTLSRPVSVGRATPYISVLGAALPLTGHNFVINGLEWGDSISDKRGALLRQVITITFAKQVDDPAATITRRSKTTAVGQRTYRWAKGDTIQRVAQHMLGKATRWPEITKLNGIRDWHSIKIGQVIKVPAK